MSNPPPLTLIPELAPIEDPNEDQLGLFEKLPSYAEEHWKGMPKFESKNLRPKFQLIMSFPTRAARDEFAALIKQPITDSTRGLWYPPKANMRLHDKMYVASDEQEES